MPWKEQYKKCLAEPSVVNDVVTRTTDALAFAVPVAKFVKNEVAERSIEKAEIHQLQNISKMTVVGHKTKEEDEFAPQKMDSVRSPSPSTDTSDNGRQV